MNFGNLRCLRAQNHLKSKFGTGYQLAFNCAPGCVGDVKSFVRNNLRQAIHIETYMQACEELMCVVMSSLDTEHCRCRDH